MLFLKKFSFESPKLFIFYLGGNMENSQIEMHDVVFVVAKTDEEATDKIKKKWCGIAKSLHVDSWLIAEHVDGFTISLSESQPAKNESHLYFVNLGYYKKDVFGELHFMTLVVAQSKIDAIEKAKNKCSQDLEMLHSDNVYDLDDCIRLEEVDHYFINLDYTSLNQHMMSPINGYQKLRASPYFAGSDKNL